MTDSWSSKFGGGSYHGMWTDEAYWSGSVGTAWKKLQKYEPEYEQPAVFGALDHDKVLPKQTHTDETVFYYTKPATYNNITIEGFSPNTYAHWEYVGSKPAKPAVSKEWSAETCITEDGIAEDEGHDIADWTCKRCGFSVSLWLETEKTDA